MLINNVLYFVRQPACTHVETREPLNGVAGDLVWDHFSDHFTWQTDFSQVERKSRRY